jgi:2-methylcitrate dehydratase PrpD
MILDGFGRDWLIGSVYFKPYSCCRWIHAALDGFDDLLSRSALPPEAIDLLEVETFSRGIGLTNETKPRTLEGAQYSFPFALGVRAIHGRNALLPLDDSILGDARIEAFARKVSLKVDPAFDTMFPKSAPARVTIHAGGQRISALVTEPWGEPANPMRWEDLLDKQRLAIQPLVGPDAVAELRMALNAWRRSSVQPLQRILAKPLSRLGRNGPPGTLPHGT